MHLVVSLPKELEKFIVRLDADTKQ